MTSILKLQNILATSIVNAKNLVNIIDVFWFEKKLKNYQQR